MTAKRAKRPIALRWILLFIITAALVPTLIVQALLHVRHFQAERHRELQLHTDVARVVAEAFRVSIDDMAKEAAVMGYAILHLPPADHNAVRRFLSSLLKGRNSVRELAWLGPDGRVIASSALIAYLPASLGEQLSRLGSEHPWVLGPVQPGGEEEAFFTIVRRIEDDAGTLRGFVLVTVGTERFADSRLKVLRTGGSGFILFDERGMAAFRRPFFPFKEWGKRDFSTEQYVSAALAGRESAGILHMPITGKDWLAARTPVPGLGWVAGAGSEYSAAMARSRRDLALWGGLSLLTLFLSGLIAMRYGRIILTDLHILNDSVRAWGKDDGTGGGAAKQRISELKSIALAFESASLQKAGAELALRESQAKLEAALASMTDAVFISDAVGKFIHLNEAFATFHRFKTGEECSRTFTEYPAILDLFIADGTLAPVNQWPVPRALRGETVTNAEYGLRRRDTGETWTGSYSFGPIRDKDGVIVGSVVVGRDITESKRREMEFQRVAQLRRVALDAAHMGWWHYDPASGVLMWDKRYRKIFQVEGHQSHNDEILKRLHPEDLPGVRAKVAAALNPSDPRPYSAEYRIFLPDGSLRWIEAYGIALFDGEDEHRRAASFVGTVADITERKQMEEEIRTSRDVLEVRVAERTAELETSLKQLRESNQALRDFVFIASHDLQEPLRKVMVFGDRLRKKYLMCLGEEGTDYLERLLRSTDRMQALLSSLLDYWRVTAQSEPFQPVDLSVLAASILSDLEARLEQTGGEVHVGALPVVSAARMQMRRLLINLIDNGLKFHKEGTHPLVRLWSEETTDGYRIIVEDNGIGFADKYVEKIFTPFQRLHGRRSPYVGVGMGLAICRRIAELHGGSISASSQPEKGSTFTVTLPKKSVASSAVV